MKKFILFLALGASALTTRAQYYYPAGTGPYVQGFDGISSSLPTGWTVWKGAAPNSLGVLSSLLSGGTEYFPSYLSTDTTRTCVTNVTTGGFKNYPSAFVCNQGDDWCAATPPSYTNRALGVRQIGSATSMLDSGASFVFTIGNTLGMSNVGLSFYLQSLDTSSPRVTTWKVQYGFGASPTSFSNPTTITGTLTTGGHTFSNNLVSASFGSALDNQAQPVTFRIVTLLYSSGSGNRASTAIDSFKLNWTGNATTAISNVNAASEFGLTVIGDATPENVTFGYNVANAGAVDFAIYDMSGRMVYAEKLNTVTGGDRFTVNNLNLLSGMYIAKMTDGVSSAVARISVR